MNNKPVAWMNKTEDETVFIENTGNTKVIGGNPIPLYTHPVKKLTDEEIKSEWYKVQFNYIEFARAVLRKVQEK